MTTMIKFAGLLLFFLLVNGASAFVVFEISKPSKAVAVVGNNKSSSLRTMALGDFTAELEKPLGLIVLLSCAKDEGLGRTNL
mgnify:CR=1 FL=1